MVFKCARGGGLKEYLCDLNSFQFNIWYKMDLGNVYQLCHNNEGWRGGGGVTAVMRVYYVVTQLKFVSVVLSTYINLFISCL